jgi:hypothetical protein
MSGRKRSAATLGLLTLLVWFSVQARAEVPLFEGGGPRPADVLQGKLGSCYFHAAVAALSTFKPELITNMIRPGLFPGTFKVTFPDRSTETVYSGDIAYAREKQYDASKALWVTVLFRAYGQRVLREALNQALADTVLPAALKQPLQAVISSTDIPVLAYDRTIRTEVAEDGRIEPGRLKLKLRDQLQGVPLPDQIKDRFVTLLDSGEFFSRITEVVNQNGEIFGAYRAIGNGGLPQRVFNTFLAQNSSMIESTSAEVRNLLASHVPAVAATFLPPPGLPADSNKWYVQRHGYTILRFDQATDTVVLRNPWGHTPDPDGVLSLPFSVFTAAFDVITFGVGTK